MWNLFNSYLQDKYSFIDRNHTASWGWSYGGYATGMMLAGDLENRIKCGVSIAPVTDWVYYGEIDSTVVKVKKGFTIEEKLNLLNPLNHLILGPTAQQSIQSNAHLLFFN